MKKSKSTYSGNRKKSKSMGKAPIKGKVKKKRKKKKRRSKSSKPIEKKPSKAKTSVYQDGGGVPAPPANAPSPTGSGPLVSPADLKTEDITRVFVIPSDKFETFEDVVKSFGYSLEKELDAGSFGTIYIAYDLRHDCKVACKVMELGELYSGINDFWNKMMMCIQGRSLDPNSAQISDTKNELYIMEKVRHPYVIRVFCHFLVECGKQNRMYLFMELANGGNFAKFMEKRGKLAETPSKLYFAQILCGIGHMHSMGIAHRDIKLQNILMLSNASSISGDYILLVADFGLSYVVQRFESGEIKLNNTCCGTPAFMSPELMLQKPYDSFAADMWALGVALYLMLTMELPFNFRLVMQALVEQMNQRTWSYGELLIDEEGNQTEPTNDLQLVTKGMLEPVPGKRMKLKQLTEHQWIANEMKAAEEFATSYRQAK